MNLNIRISALSKNVLQRAAELEGDTLSHFVLSQALKSAYKRLSETQVVSLNPQEQQQFFQLLENPPPLNTAFAHAIERYKKAKESDLEI